MSCDLDRRCDLNFLFAYTFLQTKGCHIKEAFWFEYIYAMLRMMHMVIGYTYTYAIEQTYGNGVLNNNFGFSSWGSGGFYGLNSKLKV